MKAIDRAEPSFLPNFKEFLGASAFFLPLIFLVVFPSFVSAGVQSGGEETVFSSYFLGSDRSDLWKHTWDAWWVNSELQQGRFPLRSSLQNFPEGGKLYVIDPFNSLVSGLMSRLIGLTAAFNLTHLLQLYLSCMGAWLLGCCICRDKAAALVTGVIYGISPFILTSGVCSGICETTNLEWLPLSLLGLIVCFRTERPAAAVIFTSLSLCLGALGCWYYSMTCIICVVILCLWAAFVKRLPILGCEEKQKLNWFCPLIACLLSLIMISPCALAFADSLKGEGSLLAQIDITERQQAGNLEFFHKEGHFKNNAPLLGYFVPGKDNLSIADDVDLRMKTVYIGAAALLLAVLGFCGGGMACRFWALLGGVLLLMSTGPYFTYWGEDSLSVPVNPIYWAAYNFVPGFKMAVITDRLSIAVQLSAAVLAGIGVHLLRAGLKKYFIYAVCLLALTVVAEVVFVSPVPFPLPAAASAMPRQAEALAKEEGMGGVIQLPLNRIGGQMQPGEYYYWQTFHRKPMPISLTTRFPRKLFKNMLMDTLYLCEDSSYGEPLLSEYLFEGAEQLRKSGFEWICVNGNLMNGVTLRKVRSVLDQIFPNKQVFPDGAVLYKIEVKKEKGAE
ncbi:hypothetical protein IJT93_05875 [bacterium]|nr:hypothetical protein [bacterium]